MNKKLTDEQKQEFENKLRYSEEQNLVIEIGLGNELPKLQEQNTQNEKQKRLEQQPQKQGI